MRLIQLMGSTEELWNFPDEVTDEEIQSWYSDYIDRDAYDLFEQYMEDINPSIECERVFCDEVYV